MSAPSLLTINTGSSSVKVALYPMETPERAELVGQADGIGAARGGLKIGDATGVLPVESPDRFTSFDAALEALLAVLRAARPRLSLGGVGHRVVYGGSHYREPRLVDDKLLSALASLVPLDPDHLPQALDAIETVRRLYPAVPQVACFDTAFHRSMPRVATLYPLPRELRDDGVVRYGFHGLSYEFIMGELTRIDPRSARGRVIIAHLGSGASMAAVRDGAPVDTMMGFSPTGGLMMGTRPGDLDPGVLVFLLQARGMAPAEINHLLNQRSGLLGVSETTADMRELLEREPFDERARDAVDLFCYQARKFLGAMAAALGGLDTLVFTGGIGEHAAEARARICADLGFLGISLDVDRNVAHAPVISRDESRVLVRVMRTDEDRVIALHTSRLLAQHGGSHV